MSSDILSSPEAPTLDVYDNGSTWRERYTRLERAYERLEGQVVALAAREYQITDDKITNKYRQIRDGIDIWIDELQEEERQEFKAIYRNCLESNHREKIFADLGLRAGCLDRRWEEKLGRLETCIYVVLGMVISSYLRRIFERDYPLGITPSQVDFFKPIAQEMKSSSQLKDPAKYYRWKGETLSTIAIIPEFSTCCKEESDEIFDALKHDISRWLGQRSLARYDTALREKILQPAVEFHRMIHCSGKKFELAYHDFVESPVRGVALEWDLIDIASWRVSRNQDIKGVFCCLLPSLVMKVAIDQSNATFANPVLLGYKSSSLDPDRSERSSPMRQETERAASDPKQIPGHRSAQSRGSRGSTSKSHKSETSLLELGIEKMTKRWPSRPEGRWERSSSRKGNYNSVPSSPSARSKRQASIPGSRQAHTLPSSQANRAESQSAAIAMPASGERTEMSQEVRPTDRDQDQASAYEPANLDNNMERQDETGTANSGIEVPKWRYATPAEFEYSQYSEPQGYGHSHSSDG